jgi:hypothetical protein
MEKCKFCDTEIKSTLSVHNRACQNYKDFIKEITKEDLLYLYESGMSVEDIKNYYGFTHQSVVNRLFIKFGINKRTFSEASSLDRRKVKTKKTNIERYGVEHNFSKGHPSRKKFEEKLLREEGIINVFQREEVKRKTKETIKEKYGVDHIMKLDEFKKKVLDSRIDGIHFKNVSRYSSIHKEVVEFLRSMNIVLKIEHPIKKERYGYYSYDILIVGTNKLIEVNGDYYHANPMFYKPNDIFKFMDREFLASDKWEEDRIKIDYAKEYGYELLIVWEHDLKKNKVETYETILKYAKCKN